jgi:hypothetical protein
MSSDDDLLDALGSLPMADVPSERAARIKGRALVVLENERRLAGRPALRRASRLYSNAIEPALVAAACIIYLHWAFSAASAILH